MRIVYNSFEGRYSDSPRALFEALQAQGTRHEHVWLADPAHVHTFPADVATVVSGSPACITALEAADLLIANTHTDMTWQKAPGAVYLQTWHGTPLKRIHFDVRWAPPGRVERLTLDVDRWDVLLSPNRASTPVLRRAFGFAGEVLETGYPRNDILLGAGRDEVRARVRQELGIDDGTTAVLYAPTWRDDVTFAEGSPDVPLGLDVAAAALELGPGYCLLQRLHYLVTSRRPAAQGAGIRDVSFHADIAELYLAADAMVTDYSSTMFDFAVTGKPMVFHTYDLADYRDRLRGFYFDFESNSPGPLVATAGQVTATLRDLPAVVDQYASRYRQFQQRYCHLEDGHATERVLARVLAP